ncbi:MAG: hypothetical protein Q4Q23_03885 [Methanobacteriaceae archaeon]|nr:hypothetical protein [Methanobacteriaceae archaeon]
MDNSNNKILLSISILLLILVSLTTISATNDNTTTQDSIIQDSNQEIIYNQNIKEETTNNAKKPIIETNKQVISNNSQKNPIYTAQKIEEKNNIKNNLSEIWVCNGTKTGNNGTDRENAITLGEVKGFLQGNNATGDNITLYITEGFYDVKTNLDIEDITFEGDQNMVNIIGIDGSSKTILDGNNTDRILRFNNIDFRLLNVQNLTFQNGYSSSFIQNGNNIVYLGSAIEFGIPDYKLTVTDCIFKNNQLKGFVNEDSSVDIYI